MTHAQQVRGSSFPRDNPIGLLQRRDNARLLIPALGRRRLIRRLRPLSMTLHEMRGQQGNMLLFVLATFAAFSNSGSMSGLWLRTAVSCSFESSATSLSPPPIVN